MTATPPIEPDDDEGDGLIVIIAALAVLVWVVIALYLASR